MKSAVCFFVGVFALLSTTHAGPPPFPNELKYPNVIPPTHQFGTLGSKNNEFNSPQSITIAPNGDLIVADTHNDRVLRLKKDGTFVSIVAPKTKLHSPSGVAINADNTIFIADTGNQRILVAKHSAAEATVFFENEQILKEPTELSVAPGKLFVVDREAHEIEAFSLAGKHLGTIGGYGLENGQLRTPTDVAHNGTGSITVVDGDNDRIQEFSDQPPFKFKRTWGAWGSHAGLMANPFGLDIDQNGRIFVADRINHRIQVFDKTGKYLFQWGRHPIEGHEGNGRTHYPTDIAVSPDGMYTAVLEPIEHRIQVFSAKSMKGVKNVDDSAWWEKATKFHYGARVGTPTASSIAVSEPDTHAVLVFDTAELLNPKLVAKIGGHGQANGKFVRPSGFAYDKTTDEFYISDSGNKRIQTFKLESEGDNEAAGQRIPKLVSIFDFKDTGNAPLRESATLEGIPDPSAPKFHQGQLFVLDPTHGTILILEKEDGKLEFKRRISEKGKEEDQLIKPLDFSFSKDGKEIFVVDHYGGVVKVFGVADGNYIRKFGARGDGEGEFVAPFGIVSGKDGAVYITDQAANKISKFKEDGTFVKSWGSWGTDPGQFYKPKGITQMDTGDLVVLDFGNHRGQIFTSDGDWRGMFGIDDESVRRQ